MVEIETALYLGVIYFIILATYQGHRTLHNERENLLNQFKTKWEQID